MIESKISIFDLMKSAFFLWKKHFVKIAIVGLIVYVPTQICIELVATQIPIEDVEDVRLAYSIYNLIRNLIGSIALLGIINFSVKILDNKEEQKISEIILHGLTKWPKFIGIALWAGLKILLYLLLLIIPGIYKSVRLSFIDCVVSTNDNIFTDPCDESERLVEKYWWKVFDFLLLMFFLECLFEFLFIIPVYLLSESYVISFVFGVIIQIFETYFIVVRANYYFNIKRLKSRSTVSSENI